MENIFGASFSVKYANDLGLDWQDVLKAGLDDLGLRRFRLMSYWDLIEPEPGKFDFKDLDKQFELIAKRNGKVSLAIGVRQPRYPECHQATWVSDLPASEWNEALFVFIEQVVRRYKDHVSLMSYQLENEALNRNFGICSDFSRQRLREEMDLVRSLDGRHPIIMSLSNTYGLPLRRPRPDLYGISIYVKQFEGSRYHNTLIPAWYHRFRVASIRMLTGRQVFVHELQAEPWGPGAVQELDLDEQAKSMSPKQFERILKYVQRTGLTPIDLWGLEWWYWLKLNHNDDRMWQLVKNLNN